MIKQGFLKGGTEMNNTRPEDINRIDVSEAGSFNDLNVLWVGGFTKGNKDSLDFRPHNHTFFEIHLVTKGLLCYHFDGEEIHLSDNSYLIIPPNCIHSITQNSSDFAKLTVSFEVTKGTPFYSALLQKCEKAAPLPSDITDSIDFMLRRSVEKCEYTDVIIKNRIYELIALIVESYAPKPTSSIEKSTDSRLEKAKKYIDDNPQIFFICDEVAYYCNLSAKQLGRLFKTYEGCSLLEYIHKSKIAQAKQLIIETDLVFDEISRMLGFSSVNYFGKFFMRYTNLTPGEYRRIIERPKNATVPKDDRSDAQ